MEFTPDTPLYSDQVKRKGGEDILYINYLGAPFVPNICSQGEVMEQVIDSLIQNPNVSRVILVQQKNYNYDLREVSMLIEIAQLYVHFTKQERILSADKLGGESQEVFSKRHSDILGFIFLLKKDPVGAYFYLKKILVEAKAQYENSAPQTRSDLGGYIHLLDKILGMLGGSQLIISATPYFGSYHFGERGIYDKIIQPDTIPNFTFTRLVSELPDGEIVDQYKISQDDYGESLVTILKIKNEAKYFYHLSPPEHNLSEEQNALLNLARRVLIEHQPKAEEFTDTQRTRQVFFNISKDLLSDLSKTQGVRLDYKTLNNLAKILVRHTIGFGLIEVLLQDRNLQDISLNAPISKTHIFVRHQNFEECFTNVLPSQEDADSWAAKFRLISGRPLDEANPILDTQLEIGKLRARIAIIQQPLSPDGLSYSIRRHRDEPWTLPLFIKYRMLNPLSAGLLSFLVDGSRTLLIAGTRSSGKTSLLGSLMLEIMSKYRLIMIEDSLELPFESLRKLNYDIIRMKVRSSLIKGSSEVGADDGIRTSLRLGDSGLIVGEVRSDEAKALYEAMRVGALANVVAGTIHGASPYAVYDRVVNDLGVPATSFKATDLIAVANPIKSPDGLSSSKRLVQLSEVRKHWKEDPSQEGGFVDLLNYDVRKDELVASDALINGDSEIIKSVASNVRGWAGNWDAVYDNIELRAKIKEEIVKMSEKTKNENLLEAPFNVLSNDSFHKISDKITREVGIPVSERVFPEWQKWLNSEIKKRKI